MPASHDAGVVASIEWRMSFAALLSRIETGPQRCRTAAAIAGIAAASARSAGTKTGACTTSASDAANRSPFVTSMSQNPTREPARAKCSTRLAPMPVAPPVMSTPRSRRLG